MKKIIIVLIVLLGCYFGYKGYLLIGYGNIDDNIKIDNSKIFAKTINVTKNIDNQISFDSLIDGTYLPDYKKVSSGEMFVLYDDDHKVTNYYIVDIMPEYRLLLSYDYVLEDINKNVYLQDIQIVNFLKKNNITSDIDLFKYIKDNYYLKSNIFNTIRTIKNNRMINEFVAIALPSFKSIDLISDNYGYIININDNLKEIHLLHDDKQYIIALSGEELTKEDFISNLLGTISFDN